MGNGARSSSNDGTARLVGSDVSGTMRWSCSVGVDRGPSEGSDSIDVGAYDKVSRTLDSGATDVDVQLQPASAAGKVHILRASSYDEDITFSADAGTTSFALLRGRRAAAPRGQSVEYTCTPISGTSRHQSAIRTRDHGPRSRSPRCPLMH